MKVNPICEICWIYRVLPLRFPQVATPPSTMCATRTTRTLETRWTASSWGRPWNISICFSQMTPTSSAWTSLSSTQRHTPYLYGLPLCDTNANSANFSGLDYHQDYSFVVSVSDLCTHSLSLWIPLVQFVAVPCIFIWLVVFVACTCADAGERGSFLF